MSHAVGHVGFAVVTGDDTSEPAFADGGVEFGVVVNLTFQVRLDEDGKADVAVMGIFGFEVYHTSDCGFVDLFLRNSGSWFCVGEARAGLGDEADEFFL